MHGKAFIGKVRDGTSLLRGDLLLYCTSSIVGSSYLIFPYSSVELLLLNQQGMKSTGNTKPGCYQTLPYILLLFFLSETIKIIIFQIVILSNLNNSEKKEKGKESREIFSSEPLYQRTSTC